jgi:hypothetical protein
MKRLLLILVLAFAGCAAQSLNDKAFIAYDTLTAAAKSSTSALRAGQITVAKDQKNQAIITAAVLAVDAAKKTGDAAAVSKATATADAIKANPAADIKE